MRTDIKWHNNQHNGLSNKDNSTIRSIDGILIPDIQKENMLMHEKSGL